MAYYIPTARTQKSGFHEPHLSHRLNNCTCATAAVALDYHTAGRVKVYPGDIRHHQPDQVLGTSLQDVAIAWRYYGFDLELRNSGRAGVQAALLDGRCVILPVDSGRLPFGACSRSQNVDHSILLHPRRKGSQHLELVYTMDPWCTPARWEWMDRSDIFRAMLNDSFAVTRRREP